MKLRTIYNSLGVLVIVQVITANQTLAAETWQGQNTGAAGNRQLWNLSANWNPNQIPTSSDDVIFDNTAKQSTAQINTAAVARSITFSSGGPFTLSEDTPRSLTIGIAGLTDGIVNNASSLQTFSVGTVSIAVSQNWKAVSGDLTFSGTTLGLGASHSLTLIPSASHTITINNQVTGSGTSGLIVNGNSAGTLVLGGANNSYTGGTTLTAGTLKLTSPSALPSAGAVNFNGGTVALNNQNVTGAGSLGALSLQANSSILLAPGTPNGSITFASATRSGGVLSIFGWTGTGVGSAQWGHAGTDDRIFITGSIGSGFLNNVQFYSSVDTSVPIGSGAAIISGNELVPVPEPINVALGIFGVAFVSANFGRRFLRKATLIPAVG